MIQHNETLIIDSQYFASVNYINTLFHFSNVKIELYESFQKMSFRNRCVVAGSNGLIQLSVPLENGRDQRRLTKDIRISYSLNWQLQHWRTIESCYNRSPFYEYYRPWLEEFFSRRPVFLVDMNREILDWLTRQLKIPAVVGTTDVYLHRYPETFTDKRNHFLPKNFQQGPFVAYTQVFADRIGFQPNLSILDLLFCCGPGAGLYLQNRYLAV